MPVLFAVLLYLAVSAGIQWSALVASEPSLLLPFAGSPLRLGHQLDQNMTLAVITGNAHRMLHDPGALLREGPCFPLPDAYVLGEHMLGISLLTAPGLAAGFDPTLALNLALVATRVIAATGMFLLARRLVRDSFAAFVAGAVFGFGYLRVTDPVHPFVWGDQWTPFAMLFLDRVLAPDTRRPGRAAAALSLAVTLMIGESIYALLAGAIVGAVWLAFLAWTSREQLERRWPLLVAAAIPPLLVGAWLLLPYLSADELVASARAARFPFDVSYLAPGSRFFPGVLPLVLAVVGLLGGRSAAAAGRPDPRFALALAAALVAFAAVDDVPVPGTDLRIPSPLALARDHVPFLAAVRAPFCVLSGLSLCLALLAAFGVARLGSRLRPALRGALAGGLVTAWLAELYVPAVATASFGRPADLAPERWALAAEDRAVVAAIEGPVVDFPGGVRQRFGDSFLLAAHHRRPFASCYNSRTSPFRASLDALLAELPADGVIAALAALGFRDLVVHAHDLKADEQPVIAALDRSPLLERAASSPGHVLFRIRASGAPTAGFDALAAAPLSCQVRRGRDDEPTVSLRVQNGSAETYRHPEPLRLARVVAVWRADGSGRVVRTEGRLGLPLALPPGGAQRLTPVLAAPRAPGTYTLEVSLVGPPAQRLGSCRVTIPRGDWGKRGPAR